MSNAEEEYFRKTDASARFDFKKEEKSAFRVERGLTEDTIRVISEDKEEPEWMLKRRLRSLKFWESLPMPTDWPGQPDLAEVDVNAIIPYIRPDVEVRGGVKDWNDLPEDIRDTFDKLGIPEAERRALSGVGAQYESEIVYQNMSSEWEEKGVIFMDMDRAVREHPDTVSYTHLTLPTPPYV